MLRILFALSAPLFLYAQGTQPAKTPLTPAQTLQVRNLSELEFSPDGRQLVFTVREPVKGASAQSHLWVLREPAGEPRQWTSSSKSETHPRWSPDGQQIAFLAGEPKSEAEDKKERDKDDARVVDRDEKRARVWVVDVKSHKVRQVTKEPWRVLEICWLPENGELVVKASDHPEADQWKDRIYTVSIADGQFTEVAAPRGPFGVLKVAPGGRNLAYLASPGDGPSEHDLFVQPLDAKPARNLTGPQLDRPIGQYDWRPDGSILAAVQNGFTRELRSIHGEAIQRIHPEFKLSPLDIAIAGQGTLALVAGDSTTIPELWISTSGAELKRVSHFNDNWDKIALQPVEVVDVVVSRFGGQPQVRQPRKQA